MPNNLNSPQFKKVVGQILEPFALGLLALLFIIPTLTVFNLSPITKTFEKLDVLGVSSNEDVSFTLVEGKHDIIRSESLVKNEDGDYIYSTTLNKRASDSYSKPIIELKNNTQEQQTIVLYGQTKTPTRSNISVIINDHPYKLQDESNNTYPQEITMDPGKSTIMFLAIENLSGVQFSEEFEMHLTVKTDL